MTRYTRIFAELESRNEGALVPFIMLGDPDPEMTLRIVDIVVQAGADALELGIPFSDPIADGPVIQRAAGRALEVGVSPTRCLDLAHAIRLRYPDLPLGLLVYANLVFHHGVEPFYRNAADSGVDSVLVADVPMDEAEPLLKAARTAGIAPVFLLPHDADATTTDRIARASEGYTYVLGRAGVTGHDARTGRPDSTLLTRLREAGGAPAMVGFGVSTVGQVGEILAAGAAGAIVGSALVALIERYRNEPEEMLGRIGGLVRALKEATRSGIPSGLSA